MNMIPLMTTDGQRYLVVSASYVIHECDQSDLALNTTALDALRLAQYIGLAYESGNRYYPELTMLFARQATIVWC